jgi:hypothetical protein
MGNALSYLEYISLKKELEITEYRIEMSEDKEHYEKKRIELMAKLEKDKYAGYSQVNRYTFR